MIARSSLLVRNERLQHAVHHHVGVPPYGRGEVGVEVEVQGEVVGVRLLVAYEVLCLAHAASHDHHLHAEAQHLPVLLVYGLAGAEYRSGVGPVPIQTQVGGEHLREPCGLLLVRCPVVAENRDLPKPRVGQVLRHAPVREEHELLNDPVRGRVFLEVVARRDAVLALSRVEDHLLLGDGEGSAGETTPAHLPTHVVQQENIILDLLPRVSTVDRRPVDLLAIQHLLHFIVIQAAARSHGRLFEPRCRVSAQLARVKVQPEEDREGQLRLIWVEGAQKVAQAVRQHRHHTVDQVDRRCPALSLCVRDAAELEEVSDVGYVDADLYLVSSGNSVDVDRVVEVLGRGRVDREDPLPSQVQPPSDLHVEGVVGYLDQVVDFVELLVLKLEVVLDEIVLDERVLLLRSEVASLTHALALQPAQG
mmetsp:Transcript_84589/g.252062  ORF Transcript_84589/g.252062 Transcript_84589/m.252062 type:complete len:420 (-) Transcript_84589:558-1817(-)